MGTGGLTMGIRELTIVTTQGCISGFIEDVSERISQGVTAASRETMRITRATVAPAIDVMTRNPRERAAIGEIPDCCHETVWCHSQALYLPCHDIRKFLRHLSQGIRSVFAEILHYLLLVVEGKHFSEQDRPHSRRNVENTVSKGIT
jgi:hypothetical protein